MGNTLEISQSMPQMRASADFADQMRDVYGEYARHAFIVSTGLFALSPGFSLMAA